jgi:hypothetical protein
MFLFEKQQLHRFFFARSHDTPFDRWPHDGFGDPDLARAGSTREVRPQAARQLSTVRPRP